jgi:primosomal protein N' (replication factor Y)
VQAFVTSPTQPAQAAAIAVVAPLDKALNYAIPADLAGQVRIGSRVRVPLGRRHVVGYVMAFVDPGETALKEILEVIDASPLFHARHAAFYLRAARYYAYPPGEAVRTALPAGLSNLDSKPSVLRDKLYRATLGAEQPQGARQREILDFVREAKQASLSQLRRQFGTPHVVLQRLLELNFLQVEDIERCRDPFAEIAVGVRQAFELNPAQQQAVTQVEQALHGPAAFHAFLLHGVTGSGKTEVYLRAIAKTLELGRQALVLVPEIALTPQLVARFRSWFQDQDVRLAVLHSGLSDGERYDAWRQVARGDIDVVIGARSAVFAPLPELGLIVVDEEHDGSYKQSEGFRYNARDLALMRGQMDEAVVLLGSATPVLTTYQRALGGHLTYLELPQRTAERPLPDIQLVDLSQHEGDNLLSEPLQSALEEALTAGEQTLLLLNRRGYAPFLLCHDCGATLRCPNCDITLTYSQVQRSLRCHYCDYHQRPPENCERCNGVRLLPEGMGTERLEEEILQNFPTARVARMDRDTTTRKGAHHRLIEQMTSGEIDVLIGTQMIAKGHDFPAVTLVGVLNADTALNLPDFRSAERVFSLLSQVAGRAGRGDRLGRVMIQTYAVDNYALDYVARHDYQGFAALELSQRQVLAYPPFGYLVNLVLSGNDENKVHGTAEQLSANLSSGMTMDVDVEVLGPAPCLLPRLRNKHRVQILLKAKQREPLRRRIEQLGRLRSQLPAGIVLTVDVDPVDMF